MKDFQQFSRKELRHNGLKIPQTFVKPVSLEKIRENSAAKAKESNRDSERQKQNIPNQTKMNNNEIYEKILQKKLLAKPEQSNLNNSDKKSKIKFLKLQERSDKLYEDHSIREEKKINKQKVYQAQKLKQCTFKPKILNESENKRTLKQFLDFQNNHCQRKAQKIDHLKQELKKNTQQLLTFKPQICRNPQINILNTQENVHQRLFEQAKLKIEKSKQEKQHQEQQQQQTLTRKALSIKKLSVNHSMERFPSNQLKKAPSIKSIARNNITERSHQESSKKSEISNITSTTPKSTSSNQKHVITKVLKEILQNCQALNITQSIINYIEYVDLMTLMHFVKPDNPNLYNQKKLLLQLWNYLRTNENQMIQIYKLTKAMLSIIGIHNMKLFEKIVNESQQFNFFKCLQQEKRNTNNTNTSMSSLNNGGSSYIDERQSRKIRKNFEIFFTIRLNDDTKKNVDGNVPSFKPEILEASKNLAQKFRNKVLQETSQLLRNKQIAYNIPENGEINHIDLLMLQKKVSQAKIKKNREQKQIIQQQKINQSCKKTAHSTNSLRYLDLYALSNKNQKRDKTADQINAEKYKQELTFKPNIIHREVDNWQPVAKDIDKTLFRMFEARKMKDQQEKQRTTSSKSKTSKNKSQLENAEKIPILYLNVNVDNNHIERLSIFEGDDPNQLAQQFATKFKLDTLARIRLSKLIKSEIDQVLWNIEQVDEN